MLGSLCVQITCLNMLSFCVDCESHVFAMDGMQPSYFNVIATSIQPLTVFLSCHDCNSLFCSKHKQIHDHYCNKNILPSENVMYANNI